MPSPAWTLLRSEPYRLLFPLGWLWGLAATWHWVALLMGWTQDYAPRYHGYLQTLGFGGGIAGGFLFTALPFFLNARPAATWELLLAAGLLLALGAAAVAGHLDAALLAFFLLNAMLILFILRRYNRAQGAPPPVTYVAWGLAHGLAGSALALLEPAAWPTLGSRMVEQGFLLSLILGIGSFLGARFLGTFQPPAFLFRLRFGARPLPPPIAMQRVFALGGLLLFASFWIEAMASPTAGKLLRAAVASFQFLAFARIHRRPRTRSWTAHALWLAYWMVLAGLWLAALLPRHEIAALHVMFIGGFGLMMLAMGLRVITSHGGVEAWWDTARGLPALLAAGALTAVALRVAANLWPARYLPLLAAGASVWLTVLLAWGLRLLPRVTPRHRPGSKSQSES
jgi:uncharacterized protein involved in response to NO